MLLAHSADPKRGIPVQSYAAHVGGVVSRALKAAEGTASFAVADGGLLCEVVRRAAEFHDLGKLDAENQAVLAGKVKAKNLPVQHTDAGTAYLLNGGGGPSAALVRSHHIGLPDIIEESNRADDAVLRDNNVCERVDRSLEQLIALHQQAIAGSTCNTESGAGPVGDVSLFLRIALSCLADADHSDTAVHYREYPESDYRIELRAEERLQALDRYVASLGNEHDERSCLRAEMYNDCRDTVITAPISSCDSPVGTGKTTAVMAHLLAQANIRGLRRIFVVLPFTNIITQSVEIYRKALVLPGENPEEIIAELHHRADFQDVHTRHLTALWKAPIIVTTAVSFFETLASNTPATLRRLHNLPGSAVFVDESHAALPVKLLPLAWHWMKEFAREWRCYWVMASGSLNRFWQILEFDDDPPSVPEIVPDTLRDRLASYEKERVIYRYKKEPQSVGKLVEWVASLPGPRIVILNTVQSAAVAAREFAKKFGRGAVEHLSTALTPRDRTATLRRVKSRLEHPQYERDGDWALFATSCVEAGVDLSFRTGVRELGSLVSLLQTAGRVNRHGKNEDAEVWTIRLSEDGLLKHHPGFKDAATVLLELFEAGAKIAPALCTEALKREIRTAGVFRNDLSTAEQQQRFPQVEQMFKVIATDTRTVVIDAQLVQRLVRHEPVDWRELQQGSVQIWGYRLEQLRVQEIAGRERIYNWQYPYDDFLGYMAGVLPVLECEQFNGAII